MQEVSGPFLAVVLGVMVLTGVAHLPQYLVNAFFWNVPLREISLLSVVLKSGPLFPVRAPRQVSLVVVGVADEHLVLAVVEHEEPMHRP
uniref:Putative secreted protein n=1 Tax=Rhipicephalus microplus TaxID=6941 RepID=A0A6M2DDL3_RHIMP